MGTIMDMNKNMHMHMNMNMGIDINIIMNINININMNMMQEALQLHGGSGVKRVYGQLDVASLWSPELFATLQAMDDATGR